MKIIAKQRAGCVVVTVYDDTAVKRYVFIGCDIVKALRRIAEGGCQGTING